METCEVHQEMIEQMNKRPTVGSIWTVVGIFLGVCVTLLVLAFASTNANVEKAVSSINRDVEKIQVSAEKIQTAVQENTIHMTVMQEDYKVWKKNAPPYHTHHTDGKITKP